jgi:2-succinyl-6-hydroxy-2,4-cyclohexadiene-1-carboxylate synthase
LLIHGFTGRGAAWSPLLPALRARMTTIQVDLLGHGRSDSPDAARHAVERQAADLAVVCRRIAARPVAVLGYSFGARIALALALTEPTAVSRLVLESPSAGIADPGERGSRRAADDRLAAEIERDGIPAFVDRWEALPLFSTLAALPPAARARLHAARLRNNPSGLAASLRGAGQGAMTPLHEELCVIRVPTLVLCGALDPARSRAESVAAGISGARLVAIPGVGHTPHLESPAAFRAAVLPFLDATNPQEIH